MDSPHFNKPAMKTQWGRDSLKHRACAFLFGLVLTLGFMFLASMTVWGYDCNDAFADFKADHPWWIGGSCPAGETCSCTQAEVDAGTCNITNIIPWPSSWSVVSAECVDGKMVYQCDGESRGIIHTFTHYSQQSCSDDDSEDCPEDEDCPDNGGWS